MKQSELQEQILAAPERLHVDWVQLPGTDLEVSAQPVRWEDSTGPIIPVSAPTAQLCADMLSAYLTTPELDDMIWAAASVRIGPYLMVNDGSWSQSMRWAAWADDELRQHHVGPGTIVTFGDKTWPLAAAPPGRVANYGVHVPDSECGSTAARMWRGMQTYAAFRQCGARVVQPLASAHNASHVDYSQHCRLWRPIQCASPDLSPSVALAHAIGTRAPNLRLHV